MTKPLQISFLRTYVDLFRNRRFVPKYDRVGERLLYSNKQISAIKSRNDFNPLNLAIYGN